MQYYTHLNPIFQTNPEEGKRDARGWKTLNGFKREAKRLAYCLIQNERRQGRKYTWHLRVNIGEVLTDDGHKQLWKMATKHLRQHIAAFWIREPDTDNHVNYHLLVNSEISERRLRKCLESAFDSQFNITPGIAPVYSTFGLCRYITKADEKYRDERLLFAKYCTLNKHGTVGAFWHTKPAQIWADCIETERRISRVIYDHYPVTQAAKYLHWCCDGWVPFRRIRRNLASKYPDNESVISDLACRWEEEYPGT